jgi:hypothetical protein
MDAQERPTGCTLMGFIQKTNTGKATFQRTNAPTQEALAQLVLTISHRVARYLERQGILQFDEESSYLQLDGMDDDPMLGQLSDSSGDSARTQGIDVTDSTSG